MTLVRLALLLTCSSTSFAAIHCVGPSATGNGSGSDWNNQMGGLPASPTRGDTYYLRGGPAYYSAYTMNSVSGTAMILIKKATLGDHGTDTGWVSTYDTGGPAIFWSSSFNSYYNNASYVEWDGVEGTGLNTNLSGANCYGIVFWMSNYVAAATYSYFQADVFMNNAGTTFTSNTFRSCLFLGPGRSYGSGICNFNSMMWSTSGNTDHQYLTNCCYTDFASAIQNNAGNNASFLAEHCYFWRGSSGDAANHSEMFAMGGSGDWTIRYNRFDTMYGTAGATAYLAQTITGSPTINIYGNVAGTLNPYLGSNETTGDGFYRTTGGGGGSPTVYVYNNTIVGLNGNSDMISIGSGASGTLYVSNNLAQNCNSTFIGNEGSGTVYQGNNIQDTPAVTFVNPANGDFHLVASTASGSPLPSPYNMDPDGNVRGGSGSWSIGAYQYGGLTTNPVIAVSPSGLSFGSILTNTIATQTVTVQNAGSGTLAGTVSVPSPFSIVSGGTYSLGAGQSQVVTVQYAPTAAGTINQTMTFTGGGGATISVSATATNPGPVVSAIIQNATDVDPSQPGLQVFTGTVVQYSGSATDPSGLPLTWQWIYTENGGPEVVVASGAGSVSPVSFTYDSSTAGSTFVWKLRVSDSLATSESDLTVGVELAPPPAGTLSFTMSSATVTGPFVVTNGILSQPATTTVTSGGVATIVFTVTNAGTYVIQASVNAPSLSANSFYVNVDTMPVDETMAWDIMPITSGFEQRFVSRRGNGTPDADQYVPNYFNLTTGTHTLYIVGREGGTELQSISFNRLPDAPQNLHVVALGN